MIGLFDLIWNDAINTSVEDNNPDYVQLQILLDYHLLKYLTTHLIGQNPVKPPEKPIEYNTGISQTNKYPSQENVKEKQQTQRDKDELVSILETVTNISGVTIKDKILHSAINLIQYIVINYTNILSESDKTKIAMVINHLYDNSKDSAVIAAVMRLIIMSEIYMQA